jgi:acetyl esterase/lipase
LKRAGWLALIALAAIGGALVGRKSTESGATTRFAFPTSADPKAHVEVDLFHPQTNPSHTLVVFLQGNDPGEPDERAPIAAEIGQTFERRNIDVAAVTFRVSREAPPEVCVVATAKAIADVEQHGRYDRVILMGRGAGASAAASLALDTRYFDDAGFDSKLVKGVIGMRGNYDMSGARSDAPPFLLLSADRDEDRFARIDRDFAHLLASSGVKVERHIAPFRDAHSLTHLTGEDNDLGELVTGFVERGIVPLEPDAGVIELQKRWDEAPPLDLSELRAGMRKTYPVDAALKSTLDVLFSRYPYVLHQLPGKTYEAIDLASWLAARSENEVGKGDWLVVTNLRDEKLYYTRKEIETLKPQLVVGLDDEPNLYKLFGYYRLRQDYTWKTPLSTGQRPMPLMIRPLGAFLHFPTPVPPELVNKSYAPFGLTAKSFHWQEQDPLAAVRDVPPAVLPTLIGEQGCLKCHSWRGAGSKAHHLLASDGKPYGAFALAFEDYPEDVLRRFLYEQESVAKSFEVSPLMVPKPIADELYALVTSRRK